jgi:hypothetical protein
MRIRRMRMSKGTKYQRQKAEEEAEFETKIGLFR